ncbi:MAG: hypothetical protein FWG27_08975 [Treponema sp.]|nr:hypothetical protein [Treponema sp.]
MPQRTDLYTVLYSYAKKNQSPRINMETFIFFLEKYSQRICEDKPEWKKWTEGTGTKVWMDVNHLAEEGKVLITNNEKGNHLYFSHYYVEQVKESYRNADEESDMPFPSETSLNIEIPRDQIRPMDIITDFVQFLENPQEEPLPVIKLIFPHERGSALVLASMIPFTLLEFSILKARNYLLKHGNREYVQRKLAPQLIGKDDHLLEILDQIMIRPEECRNDLKNGREASFHFWGHFCSLVKFDLNQKKDLLEEETGALQAIYIIEACCSFFKARAARAKEIELAFKNFELEMETPPYFFSREDIARFKDNKGVLLLGIYTQEGLDAYIKKRTTEPVTPEELPDFLFFHTEDGKSWLVKKNKVLTLCARLFTETRPLVIKAITKRWKKMIREFSRESAMEEDRDFERLIASYVNKFAPVLRALLNDRLLYLVHEETVSSEKGIPESSRLFNRDELLPLRSLLLLKRKQLYSDIKLLMPFWYSVPIISNIIAFFVNLGKKKKIWQEEETSVTENESEDPLKKLRSMATAEVTKLVPSGQTLETFLEELISRWGQLINKKARDNLVEDVNSLVRDKLRQMLRLQKHLVVNQDTLTKMADSILDTSKGLMKIGEQNALYLYIKLYLVKLLVNRIVT